MPVELVLLILSRFNPRHAWTRILFTHGDVQELAGFQAIQPVLLNKDRRGIFQPVLTQRLSCFGRNAFSREK
jgi:hypothetical protein